MCHWKRSALDKMKKKAQKDAKSRNVKNANINPLF